MNLCPFCTLPPERILLTSAHGIVIRDGFQPLVQQLARSHWIDHIKRNKQNIILLGQNNDLESFLFETSRQSLVIVQTGLRKISNKCFYCGKSVKEADVDHFISHSLYPRDLAHNFVLADSACNRSKSDTLAAKAHCTDGWNLFNLTQTTCLRLVMTKASLQMKN